jgi:hypothetical protein
VLLVLSNPQYEWYDVSVVTTVRDLAVFWSERSALNMIVHSEVGCDMLNSLFFVSAAKILEKNIIEKKVNEYHPGTTMTITEYSEH